MALRHSPWHLRAPTGVQVTLTRGHKHHLFGRQRGRKKNAAVSTGDGVQVTLTQGVKHQLFGKQRGRKKDTSVSPGEQHVVDALWRIPGLARGSFSCLLIESIHLCSKAPPSPRPSRGLARQASLALCRRCQSPVCCPGVPLSSPRGAPPRKHRAR